jgi:hypothetical protein
MSEENMIGTASEVAARVENLVKRYGSGPAAVTALGGVSVEIPAGSFTATSRRPGPAWARAAAAPGRSLRRSARRSGAFPGSPRPTA